MEQRFDLVPENRTNYVAVMKLNEVWQDHIARACRDYDEKTFAVDDFKTHLDHIVGLINSAEGLDEKSIEYVVFLYERMKEFCNQLEIMKAYLDTIPRGVYGLTRASDDLVAIGVWTPGDEGTLSTEEIRWMRDFEREVGDLYHRDYDAMRSEGFHGTLYYGIPLDYQSLHRILAYAGGNTLANMIERLNTHIEMLENSGILSMRPLYVLK